MAEERPSSKISESSGSTSAQTERPAATIDRFLSYLAPAIWKPDQEGVVPTPSWPPDVFAMAASLLQESGGYARVVQEWPPEQYRQDLDSYRKTITSVGHAWRRSDFSKVPPQIDHWWRILCSHAFERVQDIGREGRLNDLCDALIQLCCAADEAIGIVGVPRLAGSCGQTPCEPSPAIEAAPYDESDEFSSRAEALLQKHGTLCAQISPAVTRVLPKAHTPQTGITLRSLTHFVTLCPAGEVDSKWFQLPADESDPVFSSDVLERGLNLLLIPWPFKVYPSEFTPVESSPASSESLPKRYGLFKYDRPIDGKLASILDGIICRAEKVIGTVHGIVFPEASLHTDEYDFVSTLVVEKHKKFLIAGVFGPDQNYSAFDYPSGAAGNETYIQQAKHHRWLLTGPQVIQYGLGARLDPHKLWWEKIPVGQRSVTFLALHKNLVLTVFICEDLARQDPVAEIVRRVAPNLVIALLMDGPQLAARWPARYATSLADDPGCSVLTLSSLGMVQLSRPAACPEPSRVIGLWKDADSAHAREITLDPGAEAVVLSLSWQPSKEFTSDGRSDRSTSCSPRLSGIHPVSLVNC